MYDAIIFTDQTHERHKITIALGGYKVASVLRKHGYPTLVVNHVSYYTLEEMKELIDLTVSEQTKFVGFSTTFFKPVVHDEGKLKLLGALSAPESPFPQGRDFGNEIFEYIRSKNPNVKFVLGGGVVRIDWDSPYVDYVMSGYCELSILDLMKHLSDGTPLLKSKTLDNGIVVLDDLAAAYKFKEDPMIWEDTDVVNHKVLPMEIGRGCIFKCKFCSFPLNGRKNADYVKLPEIVYQELLDNYNKFGIYHYFITDDTFNESIEKMQMMEEIVQRLPFKPIFWAFIRLELVCTKPETLPILYNMGVRAFLFGIETMDINAGRIIGKGFSRERQMEMIRHVRETYPDVTMHGSFIAGLPQEPRESWELTLQQLTTGEIPLHSWTMGALYLAKLGSIKYHSQFDLEYEKYGFREVGNNGMTIFWENEQGETFLDMSREVAEKIEVSKKEGEYYISGSDCLAIVNFGYDFHEVAKTKLYGFNWEELDDKVADFIQTYKNKLLALIKTRLDI